MFDSQLLAFTAVAAVLTVTPGADTLLVLKNALARGRQAGWRTSLGVCSGLLVHATLSGLGVSVILATSAVAFAAVKWLGALYLVYLGLRSILDSRRREDPATPAPESIRRGRPFWEGFLTNILNPKVAVFYLAFLPQFISPGDPVLAKSILLATIHAVMGVVWLGIVSVLAGRGRGWLMHPTARQWVARISGGILVGLGARLALSNR